VHRVHGGPRRAVHGFIKLGPSAWRSMAEIKRTKGYGEGGGSNLYRWLWIGRPDLSMRPRSNLERPTQHGRLRFNGSEGVRSNLISAVRARLDGEAFSSGRWRRGRMHTTAAPLELAGAMPPGHSDGRNSPI
jgi:hypothetical protein